jgi:hypothetical protein
LCIGLMLIGSALLVAWQKKKLVTAAMN